MKIEVYKGYSLHINEIVLNPNGKKTQSVLIYKGKTKKICGATFADLDFEDAVKKAKSKIDSY